MNTATITLEVGKSYLTREGKAIQIVAHDTADGLHFPWFANDGTAYTDDGRYHGDGEPHASDIVAPLPAGSTVDTKPDSTEEAPAVRINTKPPGEGTPGSVQPSIDPQLGEKMAEAAKRGHLLAHADTEKVAETATTAMAIGSLKPMGEALGTGAQVPIVVGQHYLTRDGSRVVVERFDEEAEEYVYTGKVVHPPVDGPTLRRWRSDGTSSWLSRTNKDKHDLVAMVMSIERPPHPAENMAIQWEQIACAQWAGLVLANKALHSIDVGLKEGKDPLTLRRECREAGILIELALAKFPEPPRESLHKPPE